MTFFSLHISYIASDKWYLKLLSGVPDYFGRNKISSGGDMSH